MKAALNAALEQYGNRIAVIEDGRQYSYRELAEDAAKIGARFSSRKSLVFVEGGNTYHTVAAYCAAILRGHLVHVVDPGNHAHVRSLVSTYRPDHIVRCTQDAINIETNENTGSPIHADLAVLFATSGTTGSSKLVKIRSAGTLSNTRSIISYLELSPEDRAITLLKPCYSYGLSVINTHLLSGGSLILTEKSIQDRFFWRLLRTHGATNVSGVPFTFETIANMHMSFGDCPSLRFVTQAGGRLRPDLVEQFALAGKREGWKFYVMYGQTEASPRMSYLPPDLAPENPESIGIAIPGGRIEIEDEKGAAVTGPDAVGELVYYGPNVMAGYAGRREDLSVSEPVGRLATGDVGYRKANGLFVITGRKSRFVKFMGLRIGLDEVEQELVRHGLTAAAVFENENITLYHEGATSLTREGIGRTLNLPPSLFRVIRVEAIPRLSSGKIDYVGLASSTPLDERIPVAAHPLRFIADVYREALGLLAGVDYRSRSIAMIYEEILHRSNVAPSDSFSSLDGDSMNYVECMIALGDLIGLLPDNWNLLTVEELDRMHESRRGI
jgi:acyl-CoA synthetase (AMP-forming)/AMP-acid ligase II